MRSREFLEINIGRQRHTLAAEPHDRGAIGRVRLGERKYVVEAAAAQQRRLDPLGAIGGRQQDHAFDVTQIVNLAQELAENSLINVGAELIGAELRRDARQSCRRTECRARPASPS